jgi:hypothetical protein
MLASGFQVWEGSSKKFAYSWEIAEKDFVKKLHPIPPAT